jgi:PAS domain S-box-containing protein
MLNTKAFNRGAAIALIYLVFGASWILLTDQYASSTSINVLEFTEVQIFKGLAFVVLSTLIIFATTLGLHRRLVQREEQIQTLFKNDRIALIVTNRQGEITDVSPNIIALIGYSAAELKGRMFTDLLVEDTAALLMQQYDSPADDYSQFEVEGDLIHSDGYTVPLAFKGTIKWKGKGQVSYTSVVAESLADKKHAEAQKIAQQRFMETTLMHLPLGVSVHRLDTGERTLINPTFEAVYGWSADELTDVDTFFNKVYPDPKYREEIKSRILADIDSGDPNRMEWKDIRVTGKDGSQRIVYAKNIPVFEQGLMISTVYDTTAVYYAHQQLLTNKEELEHVNRELKRSNKELEEFAYVASHDLQEPLRMVAQFTKMLERKFSERIDPESSRYIHFAVDGAQRMQIMLNDLLQYSRVSTQPGELQIIEASTIVQRACEMLSLRIESAGASIRCHQLPKVSCIPSLLERLFINLFDNSLKYCSTVPPEIEVSSETKNGFHEFSVQDNGIGIDGTFAEKIFIIFQRLHNRSEYDGTGIGLAVCKRIVERHQGAIWLEKNELNQGGACFKFTLPEVVTAKPLQ